jgi:hypothetical protein
MPEMNSKRDERTEVLVPSLPFRIQGSWIATYLASRRGRPGRVAGEFRLDELLRRL